MDSILKLQPTVFISSIISEFKDLRGALRYYFISNGFRVLNSESPDFNADCSIDSMDNCKRQIENSDYFFLIIGDKPGFQFELPNKEFTSVTKEEFRHFLKLRKEGKDINPIFIMREETWNNYSESNSKIDSFQIDFIKEIIQSEITNKIILGNWRFTFKDYSDIISILETKANGLHVDLNRKRTIYREYIKREIFDILKSFLSKDSIEEPLRSLTEITKLPEIKFEGLLDNKLIQREDAAKIQVFLLLLMNREDKIRKIERVFNYIAIGEFSYFDSHTEKYYLPEYIKMIIQCLEMLDSIFTSSKNTNTYLKIIKMDLDNFQLNRMEFELVKDLYSKMDLVILKLSNLVVLFEKNWVDFEKKNDMYYQYRGTYHDMITDSNIAEYAKNKFPEITKKD